MCSVCGYVSEEIISSHNKQDRQCTCNVTLRRVRATIVAVSEQKVLHIPRVYL
jgi:C4-type Zn-finger protein